MMCDKKQYIGKKNGLISIIIPIYNVERYLNKCIESIVNQTYQNLEIILIDDGSKDQCPQICDDWAKKDNRIVVIHKQNGGLSDARNVGLDNAHGEYIGFVDSDDYIDLNMYQSLYEIMTEREGEIVQCDYLKVNENSELDLSASVKSIEKCFSRIEALDALIHEDPLNQVVWNKLYKKELFDDLRFEVGKLNEDDFFTYQIFAKADKIIYINNKYYYYLLRQTSIMGNMINLQRLDGLEARYRLFDFLKNNYPELAEEYKKILWFFIIYIYQKVLQSKDKNKKEMKKKTMEYFKYIKEDTIKMNLTSKEYLWVLFSKMSIEITALIRNKIGIGY